MVKVKKVKAKTPIQKNQNVIESVTPAKS
jgi:hypothetical protein